MPYLYIVKIFIEILFVYFCFAVLYQCIYSFFSLFAYKKKFDNAVEKFYKIVVMIPGYKEDGVIVNVAEQALKQDYPSDMYDVIVIADSFQDDTLKQLSKLPVKLQEVSFNKSTKSKALNKAMSLIDENTYDVALILDADNVMENDVLSKINTSFNQGYKVVQGHRVAKNTNTTYAVLDAISEELNNNLLGKGHRVLGLSSRLVGSGMAFDYKLLKKTMAQIDAVGGFDKELELRLMRQGYKVDYIPCAYIYDEKVQNSNVMVKQRSRWISAQFYYFYKFSISAIVHLFTKANIDFFNKWLQMALPPRLILPGVLLGVALFYGITFQYAYFYKWFILFGLLVLSYALAIPRRLYNKKMLKALFYLPQVFIKMLLSLFKIRGTNKAFVHTPHTATQVEKIKK